VLEERLHRGTGVVSRPHCRSGNNSAGRVLDDSIHRYQITAFAHQRGVKLQFAKYVRVGMVLEFQHQRVSI